MTDRIDLFRTRVPGLAFGGDYNPEQWPREVWSDDHRLMKEAGVNLVSVGIFSWAMVEPEPGRFDFGWFDEVMDGLAAAGVSACLATMTASPPPWMAELHPETLPMRADGTRLWPGGRQQYCPSSPVYRRYAARLVEQIGRRYRDHPALALWHIGNEYGVHVSTCYCDTSTEAFRSWLQHRYGTLDALNDAWSTTFWSQRYGDWQQILPPRIAPTFPNPAQQIDFLRFSSDELLACYRMERDTLREIAPHVPATTNLLGVWKPVDFFSWASELDIVSHDSYPDPADPNSHIEAAFGYDLMRSLRQGQPWLVMEQAPSAVNWRQRNSPKPPGVMRLWSWQAIAQGADSVLFFQWRQSRGGAEKYHSGMVPHGGEHTRTFQEIRDLGSELARVPSLAGTRVTAEVAVVMDWSSWWGLELDSHPSSGLRQMDANLAHYAPLFGAGVTTDVVHPTADLSGYRLVVVPNLYMADEAAARNLVEYVRAGGHLLMSFFSGIVDECDRVHLGGYPAPFRELLGLHVEEFWPLPEAGEVGIRLGDRAGAGSMWSEKIILESAQRVGEFTSGDLAGEPAITRHRFGDGVAWYLGTRPDPSTMRALVHQVLVASGVEPVLPGRPDGVQAVVRRAPDGREFLILLNHTSDSVELDLPVPMTDELTAGGAFADTVTLAPRRVAVLRRA
ncbi:beta-galactosidase [Streptomyces sp. KR80]|uniref:beta-galactosidase n=1 Tax=Streptomyces sp. KR80 TaxID=3457426 RepID=UPI003FD4A3B9